MLFLSVDLNIILQTERAKHMGDRDAAKRYGCYVKWLVIFSFILGGLMHMLWFIFLLQKFVFYSDEGIDSLDPEAMISL